MRSHLVIVGVVIQWEPISDSVRPFQLFSIAILDDLNILIKYDYYIHL
jgi:hypothetical protein